MEVEIRMMHIHPSPPPPKSDFYFYFSTLNQHSTILQPQWPSGLSTSSTVSLACQHWGLNRNHTYGRCFRLLIDKDCKFLTKNGGSLLALQLPLPIKSDHHNIGKSAESGIKHNQSITILEQHDLWE